MIERASKVCGVGTHNLIKNEKCSKPIVSIFGRQNIDKLFLINKRGARLHQTHFTVSLRTRIGSIMLPM